MVLAAGEGRRFGGAKQLAPVGPGGALLSDYALEAARATGATESVFVVRPDLEPGFRDHHRSRTPLPISYVAQRVDDLPGGRSAGGRERPWGTVHAVLSGAARTRHGCLVVNADDHYGPEAIELAGGWLATTDPAVPAAALVGYRLDQTLSAHGGVSRAVIEVDSGGSGPARVLGLAEVQDIVRDSGSGRIRGRQGGNPVELAPETVVSMNCWAVSRAVLPGLEAAFAAWLDRFGADPAAECPLPDTLAALDCPIHLLGVAHGWLGITWPGDIAAVTADLADRPAPFSSSTDAD